MISTELTEYNYFIQQLAVSAEAAKFSKQQWQETIKYPWTTYTDPDIRRQFKKHSVLGYAALDADKHEKVGLLRPLCTVKNFKIYGGVHYYTYYI